ncbi:T9SS type A sorting domain-containing protein [Patiriisocius sp. Uisw_047]|jgi:poly(3-hydroxybutyrate) depolymerase|uniref:T9SS type A sorting domain-containing protein n=1 Tax=Patiriisocius sp. Uisw_047 TaxID=3230969 RepID=UPI0039E80D04
MRTLLYIFLCFPILSVSQDLESTTNINIIKSWSQEPSGYSYPMNITVPAGTVPPNGFPVCILLHGNGGNGAGMMNEFTDILECHALVAPTGYLNSWNICTEDSDAPDIEMINDLVNILQAYSNINPNKIRILGSSNGAGLANNIFIENNNTGIDIVCAIVSHLNEPQYHLGNFYKPSASTDPLSSFCGYDNLVNPLATRKYLSISNDNDPIIPYSGGTSVVGIDFLPAETATYNIALNQGYTGSQLTSGITMGNPQITEYSYLSGDVVHIKGDAAHDTNNTQLDYIKGYFLDCADVLNIDDYALDQIKVYPNPTNSNITVTGASNQTIEYSIFNVFGQLVLSGSGTSDALQINLSELDTQMYFLKINNKVIKIIKI